MQAIGPRHRLRQQQSRERNPRFLLPTIHAEKWGQAATELRSPDLLTATCPGYRGKGCGPQTAPSRDLGLVCHIPKGLAPTSPASSSTLRNEQL